ncbi:hypothetical protein BJX70DRAFT_401629 [Aspergillus crustosus]
MGLFSFFTSKDSSSNQNHDPKFDPNTLTMVQPSSPNAPSTEKIVDEQPGRQEEMNPNQNLQLRGGGGGFCCGV